MPPEKKTERVRPWPDGKRPTAATGIADNRQLFDRHQAAAFTDISLEALEKATQRGYLVPARMHENEREGLLYTRADLMRYRKENRVREREARIVELLQRGAHPVDVYLELAPDGVKLAHVVRVLHHWARLAGIWVVEGPPGSYARWLERVGLTEIRPRQLRRVIEALLVDPHTARVAALRVSAMRATRPDDDGATARASSAGEPSAFSSPSSALPASSQASDACASASRPKAP